MKEADDAKKQVEDTNAKIAALQESFTQKLNQQASIAQAQIQQLQNQLNINNAVRQAAQVTYNQQSTAIKTQLGQISTAPATSLVQTVSAELKLPFDTFNVMTDRVQVGNDSFRAITQRVVEYKDVVAQNTLLTTQVETYKKDNASQTIAVTNLNSQLQGLITSQKQHDAEVQGQITALNDAYQKGLLAKDSQITTLTKDLKKERSFFGNVGRTMKKIGMGVLLGAGAALIIGG